MEDNRKIQSLRIAVFINPTYLVKRAEVMDILNSLPQFIKVFWGSDNANDYTAANFFTGVNASYTDFDYVFLLNFFKKEPFEGTFIYLVRQEYSVKNLLGTRQRIENLIQILETSSFEGMLTVPVDYVKSMYWEFYESWNDYYQSICQWTEDNNLALQIDRAKAPIAAENGCTLIKTSSINGFDKLQFQQPSAVFCSFALPLYIQHCGKLPAYVLQKESISNLLLGYEAQSDLHSETAKTKAEYYHSNRSYVRKLEQNIQEFKAHTGKLENDILKFKEYAEKLENDILKINTANQSLTTELQFMQKQYQDITNSFSWKLTAPLRKLASIFHK